MATNMATNECITSNLALGSWLHLAKQYGHPDVHLLRVDGESVQRQLVFAGVTPAVLEDFSTARVSPSELFAAHALLKAMLYRAVAR